MEPMERAFLCKRGEKEEEEAAAVKEIAGIVEEEREERAAVKVASMRAISSSVTISTGISGTLIAESAFDSVISA